MTVNVATSLWHHPLQIGLQQNRLETLLKGEHKMTYEDKVAAVVGGLDSDGADSEEEWAKNILRRIGITKENPNGTPPETPRVIEVKPAAMRHIPTFVCPNCNNDDTRGQVLAETAEGVSFVVECFECDAVWNTEIIKTNPF